MAEVVLDRVSKRFADGTAAVKEASFTIRDGEFFILVGPSGCGKSTLLNLIVGLEEPSGGEIRVDGRVVNGVDPKDRNMAMVFQSYALYPHMTVRENLAFPLRLARRPEEEIARRVARAAEILRIGELLDRKPAALSGGQRQRVAMGRAIVREPAAFLMDEPLSNLDARLRVQMRTEIALLQRSLGTTTIYVTHDQTEAMTLGDRIAVLRRGEVQQVGTPRELYDEPANLFVAGFIGSPPMNFLPGRIERRTLRLPVAELELPSRLSAEADGAVIAGIRPEHLVDAAAASEGAATFRARVRVLEWTGADAWAHLEIDRPNGDDDLRRILPDDAGLAPGQSGTIRLVARFGSGTAAAEGEEIDVGVDAAHVHLFDATRGMRLGPGAAGP